jgi:hypothetical protein
MNLLTPGKPFFDKSNYGVIGAGAGAAAGLMLSGVMLAAVGVPVGFAVGWYLALTKK